MEGHGDVDLGRRDEVDTQAVLVQDAEDGHEEAVGTRALLAVHVKHSDATLNGNGCRTLGRVMLAQVGNRAVAEEACPSADLAIVRVRVDDSTIVAGVHDVLDPDGDASTDDLVHSEGMDDLGAIEGQLSSLTRGDRAEEAGGRHFARIGGEDAINFLPDLEFLCTETDGSKSCTQVGVATANVFKETTRDSTEVAGDNRHSIIAVCIDTLGNCESQVLVERIVQALGYQLERDDIAQVDVDSVRATVLKQGGHVQTAEFLTNRDDHVVSLVGDSLQELSTLQNLEQLEALDINLLSVILLDQVVRDRILSSLNMVDTNGLDDVAEFLRVLLENVSSSAQETVGRSLALGRSAACRADYSGTVLAQACTTLLPGQQFVPYQALSNVFSAPLQRNAAHPTYSTMS